MKNFLTVKEAATKRKLSEGHIRQLCINGKIEGVLKHGRAWVIPCEAIEKYRPGLKGFALKKARNAEKREIQLDNINAAIRKGQAQKQAEVAAQSEEAERA